MSKIKKILGDAIILKFKGPNSVSDYFGDLCYFPMDFLKYLGEGELPNELKPALLTLRGFHDFRLHGCFYYGLWLPAVLLT